MTNYEEEQALELEALQSIFVHEGELELIDEKQFCLHVLPHPDEEGENHVECTIHVRYPDTYPDVSADVKIKESKGLSQEKLQALKFLIATSMEDNACMPMIYPVAEEIQNYLRNNNVKELTMHEEMLLREKAKNGDADGDENGDDADSDDEGAAPQEEEWRGLDIKELVPESERITPQSFAAWRENFLKETAHLSSGPKLLSAVTGKMYFQKLDQAEIAADEEKEDANFVDDVLEVELDDDPEDLSPRNGS
ncbi:unnamed protein product [Amoebophrya sp. A25]|nr:unnamed protein product [Amoebophrya sp. A25]|eukprot:GSA25T00000987001.1